VKGLFTQQNTAGKPDSPQPRASDCNPDSFGVRCNNSIVDVNNWHQVRHDFYQK